MAAEVEFCDEFRVGDVLTVTFNISQSDERRTFEQVWSCPGLTGTGRLDCGIRGVTRTSGGPAFRPATVDGPMTLREIIGRARRR